MSAADPQQKESRARSAAAASAASFLIGEGADEKRDNLRVVAGFALVAAAILAVLNVAIWHDAKQRAEAEAWHRLEAATDVRRVDVDHALEVFRREALSVAHDPAIVAAVAAAGPASDATLREQLVDVLLARVREFDFQDVMVTDGQGAAIAERGPAFERGTAAADAARLAIAADQPTWGAPERGHLALAVPVGAGPEARAIVFHADLARTLVPILAPWPGFGASSAAYIVRAVGPEVEILTHSAGANVPTSGTRLPMTRSDAMPAAMAATHVSSRMESAGPQGAVWSVTRPLKSADWGLVGQADRSEMMAGLAAVRQLLVSLDLGLAAVFFAVVFVWRRSFTVGLAQREMELTERHSRRIQAILDTAFDAVFAFDRFGRVRSANRAAETLVGRPLPSLEGMPIQRLLTWAPPPAPAQDEKASGEHARARKSGRPHARPLALPPTGQVVAGTALLADGGTARVEFSLGSSGETSGGDGGEELLYTAIVRDVRERFEAERRIREIADGLENSNRRLEEVNAQLEESSRLKSEFLANTSHELRTPLNGMIGFLQLVLDGMCDSREEEQDFLRQALQCSRHLLGLINDVLDIAKIEAGKLSLDIGPIDLEQLFEEVHTVTHVQAAQKGLTLTFEDNVGENIQARGDFGKIKQVLINLIGNSLKFTAKGSIRVTARANPDLGHLWLEVTDTGAGIAADRQKLVFEKFVQGDGSTTRKFGGTGLGLAISKSLVELMGGIIGIHSDGEGRGTRVYFSLPLWRDASNAPAEPEPPSDRIAGSPGDPLVLVVEDDPVFRQFVTAVLQRGGYRTVEADQAETAWVLARRLRPSVVMLDYALSSQDGAALRTGWDLAQRMQREPDTRHIPVVFVTGFDGELKQRLQSTAFARRPEHLVKPVEASELIARVTQLAGNVANRPIRVLMADDDPTVSAYVRKVLPADRFLVEVANNGAECLHILRTQPNGFDVLLLDLMMPEVSGYDVLREMTLSGLQASLPVMVLTNFPEPRNDEERRLLEDGLVLDVVAKTSVHENPQLLPHVLDWHLQVARAQETGLGADVTDADDDDTDEELREAA